MVEKLHVPDIWLGSKLDEVRVTNGVASESQTELSDFEVQDILGSSGGTASVEVLVEMNVEEESPSYSGRICACVIHPHPFFSFLQKISIALQFFETAI